mgnify:CR=1 FL=1
MKRNRVSQGKTDTIVRNTIHEARKLGFYNETWRRLKVYIDVDFLRRLRRQRRLSLAEAAVLLGKSRTTIWRYENDRVNMPSAMLLRLAEFYGVSIDELTTAKGLPRTDL